MESQIVATLGIGVETRVVNARAEMTWKLLRETNFKTGQREEELVKQEMKIAPPNMCFSEKAVKKIWQDKFSVAVKKYGLLSGFWGASDAGDFYWVENGESTLLKVSLYDESCDPRCEISGRPVQHLKENQDLAHSTIGVIDRETVFILPLYWEEGFSIRDPVALLPKTVRNRLRASLGETLVAPAEIAIRSNSSMSKASSFPQQ